MNVVPARGDSEVRRAGRSATASRISSCWNGFRTAASRYREDATRGLAVHRGRVRGPRDGKAERRLGDPLTPVSLEDQERAMQAAPRARVRAGRLRRRSRGPSSSLLAQRRGFDHFGYTEDPKFHDLVLDVQEGYSRSLAASASCYSGSLTRACTATSTRSPCNAHPPHRRGVRGRHERPV